MPSSSTAGPAFAAPCSVLPPSLLVRPGGGSREESINPQAAATCARARLRAFKDTAEPAALRSPPRKTKPGAQARRAGMRDTFENVILIGRPAAGKSETIDYLKRASDEERRRRFHILPFEELDDFLYVWETFEVDDLLSKHGKERLLTTRDYYFKDPFVWN